MREYRDILMENERYFSEIAAKIMKAYGFLQVSANAVRSENKSADILMKKGEYTYCVEYRFSRSRLFTSRSAVRTAERMLKDAKMKDWLPLVVVGGEMPVSLRAELANVSHCTIAVDIANLLYMTQNDRELYDELVAVLPYSVDDLLPRKPELVPLPDWNSAYGENRNWRVSTSSNLQQDRRGSMALVVTDKKPEAEIPESLLTEDWGNTNVVSVPNPISAGIDLGNNFSGGMDTGLEICMDASGSMGQMHGNPGTGKSEHLTQCRLELQQSNGELAKDLESWKGGKHASKSTQYEKLCTRTLKRLFSEDLTLWREQAQSNSNLYRFDLICKIKQDNHKDFWKMAERYFNSKYIIFEFKNYAEEVTQKEVHTTLRYLYPTALRRVAIIISPNGINEHADKAIRGALRDEGKLILTLTNNELIHMLQMQDDGENPADYLSDKLDDLLIDLEK